MSELDLIGKRVVIALGGNALGTNPKELTKKVEATARQIALMIKEGINVVVTHGNGPQVGVIDEAFTIASKDDPNTIPFVPLQDCNAMSQGYIGAQLTVALMNELKNQNIMRSVTDVVTHVVVDANDPAFTDLEKPIGSFMTEAEAKKLSATENVPVKEDAGRGWRRVVASPRPQHIVEIDAIRDLMDEGYVVVAGGGGGVPVTEQNDIYTEVEAVIDKDLVSSILAWKMKADMLIILTAVEHVFINYNTPDQRALSTMTSQEAREYIKQGQFAPGSMLPKVEACIEFVEAHPGGSALITSLDHAAEGLRGETGTLITSSL